MIGLGVLGNQPANPYQPALADGIHLRWGLLRELGFPWHGFYLYRRPAIAGRPLCLRSVSGGLKKGVWPDTKYYSAIGVVSSSENLVLTDDFPPANQVEFALDRRNYLRFDLPVGELARQIGLRIGFPAERCVDFQKLIPPPAAPQTEVTRPSPLVLQQVSFAVNGSDLKPAADMQFSSINTNNGPLMGLKCGYGVTIKLPSPNNSVELLFTNNSIGAAIAAVAEAFDSKNKMVASAQMVSAPNQLKTVTLTGQNLVRIEIRTTRNTHFLHRVCGDKLSVGGEAQAKVTAFSGSTPVRTLTIDGQAGQIALVVIDGDALSAVEIAPCAGSLVDVCYVPVAQDATQGWEKLPTIRLNMNLALGLTYPIGLPAQQADYPCSVTNPQSLLTRRVRYALPAEWDGTTFTQLHDQLVKLVEGGPTSAPMADRIFAAPADPSNPPDSNPPQLTKFYVLDMVLLGALHPALAQLLGLYWVDQTVSLNLAYDYLIVADHTGVGQRDADKVLGIIQSSGFAQLDGYIVFNKRVAAAPPLAAPDGLQAFELPGGTFPNAQGQLPPASNNAGLTWDLGGNDSDSLAPDGSVMYLVWRADLGDEATPGPAGTYNLVTIAPSNGPKPIIVTEPRLPNGVAPQRSPEWPIIPHFIDRNLLDGWYSYEVSGIDLFGRHSLKSAPSQVLLRDKIPPPMPTAVEAYALDPEDRMLQRDDAFNNWHNQLDPTAQQTLVGLRVRWRWTPQHYQQAPDTTEFRIYFHSGAILPLARDQAISWQERYYVVNYNHNFTIDPENGDRAYEIFLPSPTASSLTSVPLNPSLAEPVVYAHIGVSAADDKVHTNDQRTAGNWSNRPGNEGRVGPPAKIYRVWRTPPPPPEDVLKGERLYASPADYHSRSFFTYRWQPQTNLNLHVFRAMDDAVFKADWAKRPSAPPLSESQLEFFPAGSNQTARQAVVGELYYLNSFIGLADGFQQAMAYYRQLSDGALRVLAGLPSSESAFVQLTINPLKSDDAGNANKLGPDNPDDLILDQNQRAFIDTLDGRATTRYFYRAAFVDNAHNLGPLGLSSPPVYLRKVTPPAKPVLTKIRGGERQIELLWVKSREPDLSSYRVYRTNDAANTRDIRKMDRVADLPIAGLDLSHPEVSWTDATAPAGIDFHYCVTAFDSQTPPNQSTPSKILIGRAIDTALPQMPEWASADWVIYDAAIKSMQPWPESGVIPSSHKPAIRLELKSMADFCSVYRRIDDDRTWQLVAEPTNQASGNLVLFDVKVMPGQRARYRAVAANYLGVTSHYSPVIVVEPKELS